MAGPRAAAASSGPAVEPRFLERIDRSAVLGVPGRTVEPLPGGLTNRNFVVTTPGGRYVARLSGNDADLLGIDRDAEYRNSLAAAETGVAPPVVDRVPEAGLLVIGFLDGRTLTEADLRAGTVLPAIAAVCRTLHAGRPFVRDFNMFDIQQQYVTTVLDRGFRLPPRYLEFAPKVSELRSAMAVAPPAVVPCHNDLLAANFIDCAGRIYLIDYEYAGNNDPCFELGNIASESVLSPDQTEMLIDAYFGRHRPAMVARAFLQGLMAQYGWMLWASIQEAISEVEFDFWGWGLEKYDRAVATFDGPDLSGWIIACTTKD